MTLVDSNVLLDLLAGEQEWTAWSKAQLESAAARGPLVINDVIYAEVSARFAAFEVLDAYLDDVEIDVVPIPRAALFLAGKIFLKYRASGGACTGALSDFFIGAHAAVLKIPILTREVRRYRRYFPTVALITPGTP
jgi:predicted nucleic acid-binding protein